jgi:hypothetical protein
MSDGQVVLSSLSPVPPLLLLLLLPLLLLARYQCYRGHCLLQRLQPGGFLDDESEQHRPRLLQKHLLQVSPAGPATGWNL